jgi:chromosome segregation ATPase
MKKWLYVLFPTALLGIFLFYYFASKAETEAREKVHREQVAREVADANQKKALAEAKARDDAERRNVERAAEEAKAAKDKEEKYNSEMARIKSETDRENASAEQYAKQVSELTIELDNLHKQKDSLTREDFDLAKKIELAEVARHNAEMEIQRYTEMISNRADQSMMVKMPPPPPKDS